MDPNKNLKEEIVEQINLARTNPNKFANILQGYLKHFKGKIFKYPGITPISTNEGKSAVEDAINFLDKQDVLKALESNKDMNLLAFDSLSNILKSKSFEEIEDNNDLDSLIDKYGTISGAFAQSIEFGTNTAEMLVANLIIDDGDDARGNRLNIFKPNFKIVGIDHGTHQQFRSATVIIFCENFYSKNHSKYKENEHAEEKETKNVNTNTRRPSRTLKMKEEKEEKIEKKVEKIVDKEDNDDDFAEDEINDDDFDDGVVKVGKEIEIIQKGNKKTKIVTTKKTMKDGSIKVEKKSYDM